MHTLLGKSIHGVNELLPQNDLNLRVFENIPKSCTINLRLYTLRIKEEYRYVDFSQTNQIALIYGRI